MKKILFQVLAALVASQLWAAQQPLTEISVKQSNKGLREAINAQVVAPAQDNFTQIWEALNGSPWLAQTTAPSIHNVFWIDTTGAPPTIKYWDGDSWEVAAASGDGTYTLPVASAEALGGVKVGERLTITDGVLSADVQTTDISGKQDTLVSGTNIKTVNSTSLLGSGNIDISGSSVPDGTINGQVLLWAIDQWVASTAPWLTTSSLGAGVAAALGYAPDTAGGFLAYSTYAADPTLTVEATPTNGAGYRVPASSWAIALDADGDGSLIDETWWTTAMGAKLNVADIDDTAVNGETSKPISSNWAYDHAASTAAHGATGEVVGTTNTQTLTNKSLTAVEVDGSASAALTAAQVSNTIVTNRGQAAADVALGLPTAAAGYASVFTVGTAQSNKWGVRAGASDKIYLIAAAGTVTAGADNGYARMTAAQVGQAFACWTFQTGASEWDWICKAGSIGTSTFAAN